MTDTTPPAYLAFVYSFCLMSTSVERWQAVGQALWPQIDRGLLAEAYTLAVGKSSQGWTAGRDESGRIGRGLRFRVIDGVSHLDAQITKPENAMIGETSVRVAAIDDPPGSYMELATHRQVRGENMDLTPVVVINIEWDQPSLFSLIQTAVGRQRHIDRLVAIARVAGVSFPGDLSALTQHDEFSFSASGHFLISVMRQVRIG